jgi:hypothetical protein
MNPITASWMPCQPRAELRSSTSRSSCVSVGSSVIIVPASRRPYPRERREWGKRFGIVVALFDHVTIRGRRVGSEA